MSDLRIWRNLVESVDDDDDDDSKFDALPDSNAIRQLRPEMAVAAQEVYDAWIQDEDDDLNGGGICHLIADKIAGLLSHADIPAWTVSSSAEVHVYCIAQCRDGIFEVDIPWSRYERGGGYNWTKLPDIRFDADDVSITRIDGNPGRISLYIEDGE